MSSRLKPAGIVSAGRRTDAGRPTPEAPPAAKGRATRRATSQRQSEKVNSQAGAVGSQPPQCVPGQVQSPRAVTEASGLTRTASQGVNSRHPPNNVPAHPSNVGWTGGVASPTDSNPPLQMVQFAPDGSWRQGPVIPTGSGGSHTMYNSGPQQAPGYTLVPQPQGNSAFGSREAVPQQRPPDARPGHTMLHSQSQGGVMVQTYGSVSQAGGAPLYPSSVAGSQYGGHVMQYQGVPGQLSHVPASHVMGQGSMMWQPGQAVVSPSFDHAPSGVARNRHAFYTVQVPAGSMPPHGVSVAHGTPESSPQESGAACGGQAGTPAAGGAHMTRQPSMQFVKTSMAEGSDAASMAASGGPLSYVMPQSGGGALPPQHGAPLNVMIMTTGPAANSSAQDGGGAHQDGGGYVHAQHPQPGMMVGAHYLSCVPAFQQARGVSSQGDGEGPMGVQQQILVMQPQQRGPDASHGQAGGGQEWSGTSQEQRIQQQREQLQQKAAMRQQQAKASVPYSVYVQQPTGQMVPQGTQMISQGPPQGQLQQVPFGAGMVPVGTHMAVYSQQQHAQHPGQPVVPQVMQTHQGMQHVQYGRQGMVPMVTPQVVHYVTGPYPQVPQQQQQYMQQQQQVYHAGVPKQAAGTPQTPQSQLRPEDAAARMPVGKTSIVAGARQVQGQRSKSVRPEQNMISPRVLQRVHLMGDASSWPAQSESPRDPSGGPMVPSPSVAGRRSASADTAQSLRPLPSLQMPPGSLPPGSWHMEVTQSPAASSLSSPGSRQLHQAAFQQQQQVPNIGEQK